MKSLSLLTELFKDRINTQVLTFEDYNKEYEGFIFEIDSKYFRSRLAKLTPKKPGYFVAFWTKDEMNKNRAFSEDESCDKLVISIIDGERRGQFIFPKEALVDQGILSSSKSKGKMAIRVYPSWTQELNATATKTKKWQSKYFVDLSTTIDYHLIEQLYFKD